MSASWRAFDRNVRCSRAPSPRLFQTPTLIIWGREDEVFDAATFLQEMPSRHHVRTVHMRQQAFEAFGEWHGKIANMPAAVKALVSNGRELRCCYEAGPCG